MSLLFPARFGCPTLTRPASLVVIGRMIATVVPLTLAPQINNVLTLQLASMLFVSSICGLASCHVFRCFYGSVETMQAQLLSLQVTDLKCSCCNAHHVFPNGRRMICDRKVISGCIAIWFGSTDNFLRCFRTEVVDVITGQLQQKCLAVSSPFWAMLDMFQQDVFTSVAIHFALLQLLVGLGLMWLVCPMWTEWAKFLPYKIRSQSNSCGGELLRDLLMGLCILPGLVFAAAPFLLLSCKARQPFDL